MKTMRKIIEIDEALCNGCGDCVPSCAEGAIQIVNGKAKLVAERYCDGLGACLGECPTGALKIVEREADGFDEEAVHTHLATQQAQGVSVPSGGGGCPSSSGGGCPSAQLQAFAPKAPRVEADTETPRSALSHWPVQIRLVPPSAPFLQDADLLVAADCVPVAYAGFHTSLLDGRVVMLGCPKFDNATEYAAKFAELFAQSKVRSVAVAVMQVPCCQGLPVVVKQGMAQAGVEIPAEKIIISLEGEVLDRQPL
jgi:Pyruvate/2-oxoacid:ferredoxin oxidoreductase delta subunit